MFPSCAIPEATGQWPQELEGPQCAVIGEALGGTLRPGFGEILETLVRLSRVPTLDARVPWLVAFEQCLVNDLTPFLITEDQADEYRDALASYDASPAALRGLVARAQATFEARFSRFIPPA